MSKRRKRSHAQSAQPKPVQGTIKLRRNAEGRLYFSAPIGDELRRWRVHPKGERWLQSQGYVDGSRITGSIVHYLRESRLAYTLKPHKTRLSKGASTGSTLVDKRLQERRRQLEDDWKENIARVRGQKIGKPKLHTATQAKPAKLMNTRRSAVVSVQGKNTGKSPNHGNKVNRTVTIHQDGIVTETPKRKNEISKQQPARTASSTLSPVCKPSGEISSTGKLRGSQVPSAPDASRSRCPIDETKKWKEPTRLAKSAPDPLAAHVEPRKQARIRERAPVTTVGAALQDAPDASRSSSLTVEKEELVTLVMARIDSSIDEKPKSSSPRELPFGVPRKHVKKAAKRKKK